MQMFFLGLLYSILLIEKMLAKKRMLEKIGIAFSIYLWLSCFSLAYTSLHAQSSHLIIYNSIVLGFFPFNCLTINLLCFWLHSKLLNEICNMTLSSTFSMGLQVEIESSLYKARNVGSFVVLFCRVILRYNSVFVFPGLQNQLKMTQSKTGIWVSVSWTLFNSDHFSLKDIVYF